MTEARKIDVTLNEKQEQLIDAGNALKIAAVNFLQNQKIVEILMKKLQPEVIKESENIPLSLKNSDQLEVVKLKEDTSLKTEYKVCNLEIVMSTTSDDFLQYGNFQKIRDQIKTVVETEAPIMKNLLVRRVLTAWGIAKLGIRINAQFEQLLSEVDLNKTDVDGNIVYWSEHLNPEDYSGFRVYTNNGQKRDAEDIPYIEISNAVKEILIHQISLPLDELIRETSRLFGFARLGTNVETAMKNGIFYSIKKGYIFEKDGRFIIHDEL